VFFFHSTNSKDLEDCLQRLLVDFDEYPFDHQSKVQSQM